MHGRSTRVKMLWLWGRCGAVLAAAGILGVSVARAAEPPSFEEIKTRLNQQHNKIESKLDRLYLHTKKEMKSPFSAEELRQISDLWSPYVFPGLITHEEYWAFKGQKRYWRFIDSGDDLDTAPPAPSLPDDATPLERSYHKRIVQLRKYWEEHMAPHGKSICTRKDITKTFNGKGFWMGSAHQHVHADGRIEQQVPSFKSRVDPWVPVSWYLVRLARPLLGLEFATPEVRKASLAGLASSSLPELLKRRPYSVLKVTEVVDGAECVVLIGVPLPPETIAEKTNDKLWLDLEHGLALRKREWSMGEGRALSRLVTSDWDEFAPGFWLPKQIEVQTLIPAEATRYAKKFRGRVVLRRPTTLVQCTVNKVADDLFEVPAKSGD